MQGLGRNFLRHLRRTRLLVHVVDAASEDPVKDYRTVKEVCPLLFYHLCMICRQLPPTKKGRKIGVPSTWIRPKCPFMSGIIQFVNYYLP